MATFCFALNGRSTRNKTYVVYLRLTVGGKRKLIKTPVDIPRPSDFNAKQGRELGAWWCHHLSWYLHVSGHDDI